MSDSDSILPPAKASEKTRKSLPVSSKKYEMLNLVELRKEREINIKAMKFEEVNLIDEAILNYSNDNSEKIISQQKETLNTDINKAFEQYEKAAEEAETSANESELKIRQATDADFQATKERHLKEITDLETEKALEIMKCQRRLSAKAEEMRLKAQNQARANNVQEAIETRQEADMVEAKEINDRVDETNIRYDRFHKTLSNKQLSELQGITNSLTKNLETTEDKKNKAIALYQKKVAAFIRQSLRKAITDGSRQLVDKSKRGYLSQQLTDFVQKKLWDENRTYIFQTNE